MSPSKHSILIVEDNLDDFFILKRSFKVAAIPHDLQHVADGQQAIDYLQGVTPYFDRTAYPLPTLVLLDLKLPIKTGFDVLAWIRQQPALKNQIVIVLTSSGEAADIKRAYELGANAFLVKPTASNKLTDLVRALEGFWFQHNQFQL